MNPSEVGERAEAAMIAALTDAGMTVFVPLRASSRTDLIFEDATGLHRMQVKSGAIQGDVVRFMTCSNTSKTQRDYREDVDFFGVYCHELLAAFLVPVTAVPLTAGYLRLRPTRNNQSRKIRWAEQYRLDWSPPELTTEFTVETEATSS